MKSRRLVEIYCDGSFRKGVSDKAGWAFVVVQDGVRLFQASGVTPKPAGSWNIDGEAEAVIRALWWLIEFGPCHAHFRCDYVGCISALNQTLKKVSCAPLIALVEEVRAMPKSVHFWATHVKGHSGNRWNSEADRLARSALKYESLEEEEESAFISQALSSP